MTIVNSWFPGDFPWDDYVENGVMRAGFNTVVKNKGLKISNAVVEGALMWLEKNGIQNRLTDFMATAGQQQKTQLKKVVLPRLDDVFEPAILEKLHATDSERYDFVYHNIVSLAKWIESNCPKPRDYFAAVEAYNALHKARMGKMFGHKKDSQKMKFKHVDGQPKQQPIYFPSTFKWPEWKAALEAKNISHSAATIEGVYMWLEANEPKGAITDFIGGNDLQTRLKSTLPCIDEIVRPQVILELAAHEYDRFVIVRQNMLWLSGWIQRNLPKPSDGSERKYHEQTVVVVAPGSAGQKQSVKRVGITCSDCGDYAYVGPLATDKDMEKCSDELTDHIFKKHGQGANTRGLSDSEIAQMHRARAASTAGSV